MTEKFKFKKKKNGVTLIEYTGNDEIVVIPDTYNGEDVTIIEKDVFAIERIDFPNSNIELIKEVILPKNLEIIEARAFRTCANLQKIEFPETLKIIKQEAFFSCESLTEIHFPKSIEKIGNDCFGWCKAIKKVTSSNIELKIPPSAIDMSAKLEEVDSHLIKCLNEFHLKKLFKHYIYNWDSLSKKDTSKYIEILKKKAKLKKELFLSEDVVIINFLFEQNIKLNLETIDEYIKHYIGKDNVEITAIFLEYKNKNFTKKQVEDAKEENELIEIGLKLPTLKQFKTKWQTRTKNGELYITKYKGDSKSETIPAHTIEGVKIVDINLSYRIDFQTVETLIIEADIINLSSNAFLSCDKIKSITLPNSIETIGWYAFNNCKSLVEINLPEKIKILSESLFENCINLENIIIPENVVEIENKVFNNCKNLTKIKLPNNLEKIDFKAFRGCSKLTEITIPVSVTYIGKEAFSDCTSLKNVIFLGEIPEIGEDVFKNCPFKL